MASDSSSQRGPPAYTRDDAGVADIVAGTQHLQLSNLDDASKLPTADQCLAHLKLLHSIHALRTFVSQKDGIFGLHDADVTDTFSKNEKVDVADRAQLETTLLARLKEKRWAVYVTRATKRFEVWWMALKVNYGKPSLIHDDIESPEFENSVHPTGQRLIASAEDLPPLDVLMVWHAFMLNPRCYLEDCLLQGMMSLWQNSMPWGAIDASIDSETEEYNPGNAKGRFESFTGLKWSNSDDSDGFLVNCPNRKCRKGVVVKFTNISRDSVVQWAQSSMYEGVQDFPTGDGYADSTFFTVCQSCSEEVSHETLRAAKFVQDFLLMYNHDGTQNGSRPMPGTILDNNGAVKKYSKEDTRHFPNRLLRAMMQSGRSPLDCMSMDEIRKLVETTLLIRSIVAEANLPRRGRVHRDARINVRRMMSRYWENSSQYAIDLVGAVIRQGSFIEKMENIDWLHSHAASSTMSRLIRKYERFFHIMSEYPGTLIVPTLDVDLAWHTHQLAPTSYYMYSNMKTNGKYIDHDDKIAETKLSSGFAETSRIYQKLFKEPYSECTCWYCEAIRATHDSGVSGLFQRSAISSTQDSLYNPKNPNRPTSDPEKGPHISAHSAIRPTTKTHEKGTYKSDYDRQLHRTQTELASAYDKACKRAKKAGRPIPPKPAFLDRDLGMYQRGGSYYAGSGLMYYPFMYPIGIPFYGYACDGNMYACNPACANFTPGAVGNCAQGACGGGIAAGASCASGACGGGAGNGGAACAGGGCAGGGAGAGGCGGGGGGGCGGGGGGGCGGGGGG